MPLKMSVLMASDTQESGDGKHWWPARYMQLNDGAFTTRMRDAWMVFRGRAEAVVWDWDTTAKHPQNQTVVIEQGG